MVFLKNCKVRQKFSREGVKVLEYKAGLNRRIKFACVAMSSLVMSLCSRDLLVMSLRTITLNNNRLTVV